MFEGDTCAGKFRLMSIGDRAEGGADKMQDYSLCILSAFWHLEPYSLELRGIGHVLALYNADVKCENEALTFCKTKPHNFHE